MRIKFLSIIASFFMVSLLITSCLNDDNEVNYSPDATIHAFALDTIGYGKTYKFTIDQLNRLIYNEDSLPVHADTIIDRILIKTLTTASGIVTMRNKADTQDSIINLNDSIDLRPYVSETKSPENYLKIKVWPPDMVETRIKEYRIGIRKHFHDPDSLMWNYRGDTQIQKNAEQKSVLLDRNIKTYAVEDGHLKVYSISVDNSTFSGPETVTGGNFGSELPTSIIAYKNVLYATTKNDTKVYQSTDGVTWTENTGLFNDYDVTMLLAPLNDKIIYMTTISGKKYFNSTDNVTPPARSVVELQEVPSDFPTKNLSYTPYPIGAANIPGIVLVGGYEENQEPKVGDKKVTMPFAYMGSEWIKFETSEAASCPALEHPSIVYYNNQFYIFGSGFETIYTSEAGLAWEKANNKFSFPHYTGWGASPAPGYEPKTTPEFRGRKTYSTVFDQKLAYIWVSFSAGDATFKEKVTTPDKVRGTSEIDRTYTHNSEVWRGRLNQLWFDIANGKYPY